MVPEGNSGRAQRISIGRPKLSKTRHSVRVSARLTIGARARTIWYQFSGGAPEPNPEAFVALALLPAMSRHIALHTAGSVCSGFSSNLGHVQEIMRAWDRRLVSVQITGPRRKLAARKRKKPTALFFSGGLDSFYSLVKNREDLSHLIFVHGFDIPLQDKELRRDVSDSMRSVAAKVRKPLIEVETNAREFLDEYVHWELAHGAALASVGLLLKGMFGRMLIPATHTYVELFPWGSHPVLDRLWGVKDMEIVHDGLEATRVEKARLISSSPVALQHLRVCFINSGGAYNCGRCEKCIRTMLNLAAVNALERCTTLPRQIDPEHVRSMQIGALGMVAYAFENLAALGPEQSALRDALREAIGRYASGLNWERPIWNPFYDHSLGLPGSTRPAG